MRNVQYIVIHCTATPQSTSVESIQRHWRNVLGWRNPGYHILIEANGTRNFLAPFEKVVNGAKGWNPIAIHISYIGGVDQNNRPLDNRTDLQKAGLLTSIREALEYCRSLGLPRPQIIGHHDFPGVAKACPSFNAKKEYAWITSGTPT